MKLTKIFKMKSWKLIFLNIKFIIQKTLNFNKMIDILS